MSRTIAFFDFDGTITHKDSLLEFIKYARGTGSFYAGFALQAPFLVAYKLKLISNQRAKEIMLHYFFGKMSNEQFTGLSTSFSQTKLPALVRPKALLEINKLKAAGAEVVVVSASPEHWLRPWCQSTGVECIATRLVIDQDRVTGRIDGLNCHGEEKVRRIEERYDLGTFSAVYCYGDTVGDKPMLAVGTIRFYKPFR